MHGRIDGQMSRWADTGVDAGINIDTDIDVDAVEIEIGIEVEVQINR